MRKAKKNSGVLPLRSPEPRAQGKGRWVYKGILACFLCVLIFCLTACSSWEQPGETTAEGHRRHLRKLRIERQQIIQDVDRALMLDKPSELSYRRVP